MCLQKLMNIHRCVFKILGKKQRRGRTHGRTDGQRENSIPPPPHHTHKQSLRGYKNVCEDAQEMEHNYET